MRVISTFLAIAALIGGLTWAIPARCENCLSGFECWTDGVCGSGCDCLMINGLGKAGVCG